MTTSISCLGRTGIKSPNYDYNEGILLQKNVIPFPSHPILFHDTTLDFILIFPPLSLKHIYDALVLRSLESKDSLFV